jgi:hypothetical protein
VKLSLQQKKCIARQPSRGLGSLECAGDVLRCAQPDLIVSRQKLRQAESITLIREKRESRSQSICFTSRPFVLCGLSVRRLRQRTSKRAVHSPGDRPFLFWRSLRTRPDRAHLSRDHSGPTEKPGVALQERRADARDLRHEKGGKEYRRLIQAFERIFGATIFFGTDGERPEGTQQRLSTSCAKRNSGINGTPRRLRWTTSSRTRSF